MDKLKNKKSTSNIISPEKKPAAQTEAAKSVS